MVGTGYRAIALTALPRKPNGALVTGAWHYLVGCHSSVTGLFDALATLRASKQTANSGGGSIRFDEFGE